RVPYSQLRFTKQDEYVWGIDFMRAIERRKEEDFLCFVPKNEAKGVSSFADLVGIRNIQPPERFEVLPYVVSSSQRTNQFENGDPFNNGNNLLGNLGADMKFGLGSNLTVSATVNPDFGQVEVDPAIVNLSQFESYFDEKRPFFIEGSNYFGFGYGGTNNNYGFNWGNPDFFYSRRIGRSPQGGLQHDGFADYPSNTTILGAAKLTGKVADGWSLASLHAVTQKEIAIVEDKTTQQRFRDVVEPFTSYNVFRSQREFNDGRQALGIIGTATLRNLNEPYLENAFIKNAYTFGVDGWTNLDSSQEFVLNGWFAGSSVSGTKSRISDLQNSYLRYYQRPDATHLTFNPNATALSGYAGRFAVNKQKGNMIFNSAVGIISPGFETNDLGFQFRSDVINMHIVSGYRWTEPDGYLRRKRFEIATFRNFDFDGTRTGDGYFIFYSGQTMDYWSFNGNFMMQAASFDNRVTRGGPLMKNTNFYGGNIYLSSDSRKAVTAGAGTFTGRSESGGYRVDVFSNIEWKPSSNVTISTSPGFTRDITIAQWVGSVSDSLATHTFGTRYFFGKLDQTEFSSGVRLDYTFTPKLSLQLFLQPLISVGRYNKFKELKKPATYTFNNYGENGSTVTHIVDASTNDDYYEVDPDGINGNAPPFTFGNPDFNYKSLRGNAVLRWEFLPGSTMFFVWTQSQTNFQNPGDFSFGRDFRQLVTNADYENVFLVKLSYWWNPL
ncbi:MAG: hypothetical protein KGZ58_09465, partial [Ignavibacteriales bacterium]|nr:hypothetical protein [Ignavibacteriales bacterium]